MPFHTGHISSNLRKSTLRCNKFMVWFWRDSPQWARTASFTRFLDHTQRRTTVGRTPLDEWSVSRRYLYLTTYNKHNRQTSMPPVGFEPTILAGERPQTYALDRAATGMGMFTVALLIIIKSSNIIYLLHSSGRSMTAWTRQHIVFSSVLNWENNHSDLALRFSSRMYFI